MAGDCKKIIGRWGDEEIGRYGESSPTLKLRRVNSRRKAPERKGQAKKDSH